MASCGIPTRRSGLSTWQKVVCVPPPVSHHCAGALWPPRFARSHPPHTSSPLPQSPSVDIQSPSPSNRVFDGAFLGPLEAPKKDIEVHRPMGIFGRARLETRAQDAGHARFFPSSLRAAERICYLIGPAHARRGGGESHPCCWPRLTVAPKARCLGLRTPPRRPTPS